MLDPAAPRPGRPSTTVEIRSLVVRMARENEAFTVLLPSCPNVSAKAFTSLVVVENELTKAEFDECDLSECVHDGVQVLREQDQQFAVGDVSGRHD